MPANSVGRGSHGAEPPQPNSPRRQGAAVLINSPRLGVRQWDSVPANLKPGNAGADDAKALDSFAREQLARDIADIERATAELRRAEPALQSWSKPANPAVPKHRPVWILIGALWFVSVLVAIGAVVAIATLTG